MTAKKTKLGRYTLGEQLGSGGFGTVYKATDSIGRTVAIKVLKPGWADDPGTIERFRREAQVAGELFHNRIATIIDFDEFEGRLFLVMRYIDGIPLDKYIKEKGRLSWSETLRILGEVAEGLDYAHQRGFVHRDIKPANILISEKEGAVLTDFGLVKAAEISGMSTSGVMLGTPHYIAPEVWEGKPASPATDIYSLACVACEMLTGEVLFAGVSPPEIMTKHMQETPPLPNNWPQGVPEGVGEVMTQALAKDPSQRFSSVSVFISVLKKTGETHQKEAELEAYALIQEAEALLASGKFQQADEKLTQAVVLAPDSPIVAKLLKKVEDATRLTRLYNEAADNHLVELEKAKAVLAADPTYPDSRGIFSKLGLRGEIAQGISTSHPPPANAKLRRRLHELFIPFLLILLGLATSWVGIGIVGLIAGIGLLKRKDWARITGMVFAGLLEFAGFGIIYYLVGRMGLWGVSDWEMELNIYWMVACPIAILFAFYLFQILGGQRMATWTGGDVIGPPGIWSIFVAYLTTVIGIPPAFLLLSQEKTSRVWAQSYAIFLLIALPIAGTLAAIPMKIHGWSTSDSLTNSTGQVLTVFVTSLFMVLCWLAYRYLGKSEARAYFENREE